MSGEVPVHMCSKRNQPTRKISRPQFAKAAQVCTPPNVEQLSTPTHTKITAKSSVHKIQHLLDLEQNASAEALTE